MPSSVDGKPVSDGGDADLANYKYARGQNWTRKNVRTLMQWIHLSAIYVDILSESTRYYRRWLRRNTILNLLFSTIASTVSISQFNISTESNANLSFALKVMFSVMTATLAVATGIVKIYQIQEKLESSIQLQQDWTIFGSRITSEMQLPEDLRKDALYLIIKMKDTYAGLIKAQTYIPKTILREVAERNGVKPQDLMLSEQFERVIEGELSRMSEQDALRNIVLQVGDNDSDEGAGAGTGAIAESGPTIKVTVADAPPPPQSPVPASSARRTSMFRSGSSPAYSSARALNAISEGDTRFSKLSNLIKEKAKVSEKRSRMSAYVLEPTSLGIDEESDKVSKITFADKLAKKKGALKPVRRPSAVSEHSQLPPISEACAACGITETAGSVNTDVGRLCGDCYRRENDITNEFSEMDGEVSSNVSSSSEK